MWRCSIDCMGSITLDVNFPLHLFDQLVCIYGDKRKDSDNLTHIQDLRKYISELLHEKQILLQFTLQIDGGGEYNVQSVREADLLAYSRLLLL